MAAPHGTHFGPYELLGSIGSGAMGEVLRARDPRLGREVAIKILRSDVAASAERVRRFEQEARAAGALNHPNVLAVFDIGQQDGLPFLVTELLEGETLRARVERGPMPARKVLEVSLQLARGLAAAHEKGIVHRDLKPENVFLTRDGRAKILDFGLAKLKQEDTAHLAGPPGAHEPTEPGAILGTVGYMAPEQVRGEPTDARADLFALGALIYEMLTGKKAFDGPTRIAVLYGIIHSEAPELQGAEEPLTAALSAVLRHCLEKRPEDRFQSARDLAFQLEFLQSGQSGSGASMRRFSAPRRVSFRRQAAAALMLLMLVVGASAGAWLMRRLSQQPAHRFTRISFRRGAIRSARFAPDGQSVVYAAALDREPMQIYAASTLGVESRTLGYAPADLFAISPSGELALGLHLAPGPSSHVRMGTLSRAPLVGGAPRELVEGVQYADWAGDSLAIVRQVGAKYRIELPEGQVLAETQGWFSHLRLSPTGDQLAFIDHRLYGDDRGAVAVVDRRGHRRTVSVEYTSALGLAWRSPEEIWFTAGDGIGRSVRAVRVNDGRERVVYASPGTLDLFDLAKDGRALLGRSTASAGLIGRDPSGVERDLSWLDYSVATALSRKAGLFSFFEAGAGGGAQGSGYVRRLDGAPAIKLAAGYAWDLSADGRSVVQFAPSEPRRLRVLPTGVGEPRSLDLPLERITGARFLPDGERLVVSGNLPGHAPQLFVADGTSLRAFSPEGLDSVFYTVAPVSPDGQRVVAHARRGGYAIYGLDGITPPRPLPLTDLERPQGWASDNALYVHRPREIPQRVERLELDTLQRSRVVEFSPADPAGIAQIGPVFIEDGRVLLYGYVRSLDELYVAEGLR